MSLITYNEDILKDDYEQTTLVQTDDYEGKVIATLVRKRNKNETTKAVLYLHGFNDYFFQKNIAEEFIKHDYNFYAVDLRKYGRSILPHQKLNNVRDLSEYYEDIDSALAVIKSENNTRVVLAGHSTGGLIITLYAANRTNSNLYVALFCNSPFYDMNLPTYQKKYILPIVAAIGRKFPNLKIPGSFSELYGVSLHKDHFGEWDYNLKWKPHHAHPIHASWIAAIYEGHKRIRLGVTLDKPILIMHSKKSVYPTKWSEEMFHGDAILNVNDIIESSKKINAPHKSVVGVKDGIHDLVLSKKETRELVYTLLFDWLKKYV